MIRISFGIIVLNGQPFTKYCLRQLYPFAYEIIVVEGGTAKAALVTQNGHSTDGTLEALYEFRNEEDTENKVKIITTQGYWKNKDEQSQAYALKATGDYLWQVDIDEFYKDEDIKTISQMLENDPLIDTISFKQITFWGSPWVKADCFKLRADHWDEYHRLFKWKPGYRYATHRPPTVVDEFGIDLRKKKWVNSTKLEKEGIYLYHYSLLFPKQVIDKCKYYSNYSSEETQAYAKDILNWANNNYLVIKHPYHVHNIYHSISWLEKYSGTHPKHAMNMWNEAENGLLSCSIRENDDLFHLLRDKWYIISTIFLKLIADLFKFPPFSLIRFIYLSFVNKFS